MPAVLTLAVHSCCILMANKVVGYSLADRVLVSTFGRNIQVIYQIQTMKFYALHFPARQIFSEMIWNCNDFAGLWSCRARNIGVTENTLQMKLILNPK